MGAAPPRSSGSRRLAHKAANPASAAPHAQVLQTVCTPVLGISGDWDLFCPAPGGLRTVQHFGGGCRRFVFVGPAFGARDSGLRCLQRVCRAGGLTAGWS